MNIEQEQLFLCWNEVLMKRLQYITQCLQWGKGIFQVLLVEKKSFLLKLNVEVNHNYQKYF